MTAFHRNNNRLALDHYLGNHAYFVTITTAGKKWVFVTDAVVSFHVDVLGRTALKRAFDVIAFCYMPDHMHLLISGKDETSDLTALIRDYKQITGYHYKKQAGDFLWQKSFYDHVLRREDAFHEVVRYLLANPVRKQMVERPGDYPYSGSLFCGQAIFKC